MPIPDYSICWEFESDVKLLKSRLQLSNFQPIGPLMEAVRFALKRSSDGLNIDVSCYVNNLEQIGLAVKAVTFSSIELHRSRNRIPLYCGTVDIGTNARAVTISCIFRIYTTGSVEPYTPLRFDGLLGDQMWKAAMDKRMTDIQFVVNGRDFYAHKFILAARSRVFRSMFNAGNNEPVSINSVNPGIFEQFVQFLYTGHLAQPIVGTALGRLAETYEVETLVILCREAGSKQASVSCEEMVDLVSSFDSNSSDTFERGSSAQRYALNAKDALYSETFTVKVKNASQRSSKWLLDRAYLYKFEPDNKDEIIFYCCGQVASDVGGTVDSVEVHVQPSVGGKRNQQRSDIQCVRMDPVSLKHHQKTLQKFRTTYIDFDEFASRKKLEMRFIVRRRSLVDTMKHQLRDSLYASQMWSTAEQKQWTDIEFQVGDKIFPAHRALLAARCPKLAALAPNESLSTPIKMDDFDPSVFEELLYFLYTGQLRKKDQTFLRRVLGAGETFQIDTLKALTKWTHFANPDEISETIMSLSI